jgi:AcrR family transcriptional regulator
MTTALRRGNASLVEEGGVKEHRVKEDGRLLRGEATRQKVLDAAERLFANRGFDGVSIRDIAEEADVTLGVVGFHSGPKAQLFHMVLARRVAALSAARMQALNDLRSDPRQVVSVTSLLTAYMKPFLDIVRSGDPQWRAYAKLIAMTTHEERWNPILNELYTPYSQAFFSAIRDTLPMADPEELAAAFTMAVAAMQFAVVSTERLKANLGPLFNGFSGKQLLADYPETLIAFCSGGLERVAGQRNDRERQA